MAAAAKNDENYLLGSVPTSNRRFGQIMDKSNQFTLYSDEGEISEFDLSDRCLELFLCQ
jgi:hypothetical protein